MYFLISPAWSQNLQIPTRPTSFPLQIPQLDQGIVTSVIGWGDNTYGETTIPTGLTNIIQISAGVSHALALSSSGTVIAWGDNTYRQCSVPSGLTNVVQVQAGNNYSLALKNDGTIMGWGTGALSQVPTGLTNIVQISAGANYCLALKVDGRIVPWQLPFDPYGYNIYGITNIPADATNIVQVSASLSGPKRDRWAEGAPLALKGNGTAIVWGSYTNIPYQNSNIISVSAAEISGFSTSRALFINSTNTLIVMSFEMNNAPHPTVPYFAF